MTNYFEILITWPWFLFMFYRGCSRFFLSCQFESFLHELQDRKRKLKRSCFFFSFSLFVLTLVIRVQCLLRNRVENENCQLKIYANGGSIAKVYFLRKASFGSLYKPERAKRMSCEEGFNQWFIILLLKIHNLTLLNRIIFFLGTCRKNLPFKMDSFRKVLTILSRRN